ncbi:DNA polymerase Y family protein [Oleiharenicola lentus]|uniref:DNA polymerase Y family protein n=1 Tax=Oleiharenicola lentus TaxID=2508720 RepID=UPI003F67FC9F
MPLRYLTIDFNSFFASVEQQERPELRGKPVGIVPVMAETTGCIAVSLEAKKLGLTRNARVAEARKQCPGIVIVEARPELYIQYHRKLAAIVHSIHPTWKIQSIDEVTCKFFNETTTRAQAEKIARDIKAKISREVGPFLRSSIGIAPTWLLAKVASDMEKPDGLVVLEDADVPGKLLRLEIDDISGIGPNMALRLRAEGIDTIEKLYAADIKLFRGLWRGIVGERMWRLLHGEDVDFPQEESKQLGHGAVLPPDKRNHLDALATLHRLLQKAAMRLRHSGRYATGMQVSVEYIGEGIHWSDELQLTETQDTLKLTQALNQLWMRRPKKFERHKPVRIGVQLTGLIDLKMHTPDLFEQQAEQAHDKLFKAVDHLNKVLGKNSVYFGGAHGATKDAPMRIAFTRIPKPELEEIDRRYEGRVNSKKEFTDPEPEVW